MRKEHYLCRGMISQAILVQKFARDPHNCLLRAALGRRYSERLLTAPQLRLGREAVP